MMSTKKELAKKLATISDKSTTTIIKEYKKDQIIKKLEKAHKKGLIGKHVYIKTPKKSSQRKSISHSSGEYNHKDGYTLELTKEELAIQLAKIRPESKTSLIKKYTKDQLHKYVIDAQKKGTLTKHHIYFSTPTKKKSTSKSRSKSTSKSRSKSRSTCKSYQTRNEKGRCVNKPCKDGQIRDRVTKECRSKKTHSIRVSRSRKKSAVSCKSYQTRNEKGRCVNKPCKDGQIRDRVTKECRKKKESLDKLKHKSTKKSKKKI